jgi:hypothetical protein
MYEENFISFDFGQYLDGGYYPYNTLGIILNRAFDEALLHSLTDVRTSPC